MLCKQVKGDLFARTMRQSIMKYASVLTFVIAMCMSFSDLSAHDRGMGNLNAVFIGKGTKSAGLSFGFDSWDASGSEGFELLGIVREIEGYVRQGSVSASGSWFVQDNMCVGFRFGYSDARLSVDSTRIADLEIPDRHFSRQALEGALTCRRYLPLFDGNIIALFFEGRVTGSVGYSKNYKLTDNGKEGDYNDLWRISAGVYPGISLFATSNISFEMSLPLLEGGVRKQQQDGTDTNGSLSCMFLNFKTNLTGIRMGLVYHF